MKQLKMEHISHCQDHYIYINKEALKREEVKEFVKFYLENATEIVPEVKYVGLPEEEYTKQLDLLK